MATPGVGYYAPGTGADANVWIAERWQPGLAALTYNKAKVIKLFRVLDKPGRKLHVPRHGNLSSLILGETARGSDLTAQSLTEDERTAMPQTVYIYVPVNWNVMARMMFDPQDDLTDSCEAAVAEGYDAICAGVYLDILTGIVVGGAAEHINEATLRNVAGQLKEACKGDPEETRPFLLFHTREWNDIMGDAMFTQYQMRGDGSPLVKGWCAQAFGVDFYMTNNIKFAAGMARNLMGIPKSTFGVAWNRKPVAKHQEYLAEERIIVLADLAVLTVHPEYAALYNTAEAVAA